MQMATSAEEWSRVSILERDLSPQYEELASTQRID